jgi:hypothetical protein
MVLFWLVQVLHAPRTSLRLTRQMQNLHFHVTMVDATELKKYGVEVIFSGTTAILNLINYAN